MAGELPRNDQEEQQRFFLSHRVPSLYDSIDYPVTEKEALVSLLTKEIDYDQHHPNTHLIENDPFLAGARRESVVWILKANAHHSFSASTAVVAVNYFDGLINALLFEQSRPWVPQLAAVACLSLAAKMVEDHFPGFSGFQMEDECHSSHHPMFDAKTIKRMELLVLSKLEWKMNPITPLSFLSCLAKRLESPSNSEEENHRLSSEFLQRCVDVLFSIITDWRIMGYAPSSVASAIATFLDPSVFKSNRTISPDDHLFRLLKIQKDNVERCCKMIREARGDDTQKPKLEIVASEKAISMPKVVATETRVMPPPNSGPMVLCEDNHHQTKVVATETVVMPSEPMVLCEDHHQAVDSDSNSN